MGSVFEDGEFIKKKKVWVPKANYSQGGIWLRSRNKFFQYTEKKLTEEPSDLKELKKHNNLSNPSKEENKSSFYDKFSNTLQTTRTIILNIVIILFFIILLHYIYKQLTAKFIIIEPFEVPEQFAKEGLTGRVFANKLVDQIDWIRTKAEYPKTLPFVPNWSHSEIEAEVPGAGISLNIVSKLLRSTFRKEPVKVTGEVFRVEGETYITTRASGKPAITNSMKLESLDSVMADISQNVIKYVQPMLLAHFQYTFDKSLESCIDMIEHTILTEPTDDDYEAYLLWGYILAENNKPKEAIAKYKKALEVDPNHPYAYYNWGYELSILGDYKGAIAKYQKAVEVDPNDAHSYIGWGNALSKLGDHKGAIAKHKKALDVDPNNPYAYYNWGHELSILGDHKGAIAKYKKAVEFDPNDANAYFNWGHDLVKLGNYKGAIAKYEKALEVDPNNADAYYSWGNMLTKLRDYQGAIAKYEKALEVAPNDADAYAYVNAYAYNGWGNALSELGDHKGAMAKYEKALEVASNDADAYAYVNAYAYNGWGNALSELGDHKGAITKYEKALEFDPYISTYESWWKY